MGSGSVDELVPENELPIEVGKAQRNRMIKAGQFPRPVYPTPRRPMWLRRELDAWLKKRIDARGTHAA